MPTYKGTVTIEIEFEADNYNEAQMIGIEAVKTMEGMGRHDVRKRGVSSTLNEVKEVE